VAAEGPARAAPAASVAGSVERADQPDDLTALLAAHPASTGLDAAFAGLFRLWGKTYAHSAEGPCKTAEKFNLHCLFQRGRLEELRALDIPVIIALRDAAGGEHQLVLSGLREDMAFVDIDNREYRVRTADLERLWSGDYQLLWRPQIPVVKAFAPGMRDPDVRWLRASLARVQGRPFASVASDLYDAELEARVKDYQRDRHLTADGLVSNQTQIALISDLRISDTPRLARLN
jgi:general secretion pathway protein A